MASPTPEASVLDPNRPQEPLAESPKAPIRHLDEQQGELNGHTSLPKTLVEAPSNSTAETIDSESVVPKDSTEQSKTNGDNLSGTPNEVADENPLEHVSNIVQPEATAQKESAPPPSDLAATNSDSQPLNKPEEGVAEASESHQNTKPAPDVDMVDAGPDPVVRPEEPSAQEPEAKSTPVPKYEANATPAPKPDTDVAPVEPTIEIPQPPKEEQDDTEMADVSATAEKSKVEDAPALSTEDSTIPLPTSEVDLGPSSMSQLAIETTESDVSPSAPLATADTSMADAPGAKIPREREDDATEAPAPKRARTEPKEEEIEQNDALTNGPKIDDGIVAAGAGIGSDQALVLPNELHLWTDAEQSAKPITPYQRREIRKIITRIKKTKSGSAFRDSVEKLWPQLWDGYVAKIDEPMDLGEIERGLRESADGQSKYKTFGDLKRNLALMFDNTLKFNGPHHDVTKSASHAVQTTWKDVVVLPDEEPAKPKPVPKPVKPVRESRNASIADAARRQSVGMGAAAGGDTVENKPPTPYADQKTAGVRRDSVATEPDRPKRAIRAPKPKDIDYTTKPARKKLKPELQFCDEVLSELMSPKLHELNQWFLEPVDAEGLNIPTYYHIVKKPMDLGKVQRMLHGGEINNAKDFEKNVKQIFTNCYLFNGPVDQGNTVSAYAHRLEELFSGQLKNKDAWMAKQERANKARRSSASHASDDDEDEDEDDTVNGGGTSEEVSKIEAEVKVLESKLREETAKLNDLFVADDPVESMIKLQQNMVSMIQETLLKTKSTLAEARQRGGGKPAKKTGKTAKSKASGSRKSTGGGANAPKKPAKKAAKKNLTAADKDAIANAINDLDYMYLERAIDIIKRDTGQNENTDGELELDIDQLSNDALLKLWELCKKVLPGFGKESNAGIAETSSQSSKQAAKAGKPKKNKPMTAQEQEERIAQLREISRQYKPQEVGTDAPQAPSQHADSSDDSDSEEE